MKADYDPGRHHRRSVRMSRWDYASGGYYFVTVCTHQRDCLFGSVVEGEMALSPLGRAVDTLWHRNLQRSDPAELDVMQVMPNHLHAILILTGTDEDEPAEGAPKYRSGTLGAIIGNLKGVCARRINTIRHTPGAPVWQSSYWEHVVRSERELDAVRTYIVSNPATWSDDRLYIP